ncbi:hypothetical protein M9Y10_016903 [Tritrichomonas musculus]|uniref:Surface antigen BspA-like n=1 Tax=Tritrichomonas musculus TaxID=1915356 RepID=A0ABR2HXH4_9EUKA
MTENLQLTPPNQIIFSYEGIKYCINEEEQTVGVAGCDNQNQNIIIPKSVIYKSKEYIVTRIMQCAFKQFSINSFKFADDSKIQMIDDEAFSCSTINKIMIPAEVTRIGKRAFYSCSSLYQLEFEQGSKLQIIDDSAFAFSIIHSLSIPSKVYELKSGWCAETNKLNKISVCPENPYFKTYEDKFIFGKKNHFFDSLVFCVRNVEKVTIPMFIKYICSCAFYGCNKLKTIEFEKDSYLLSIDELAFCNTQISCLTIPSKVEELKDGWCAETPKLTKVEIDPNNRFFMVLDQNYVIGRNNAQGTDFDRLVFCSRNIEFALIPPFIKHVCSCAFYGCEKLKKIRILSGSELQTIGEFAFLRTSISSFVIPQGVTMIGKNAFVMCKELQELKIPNDFKVQVINDRTFYGISIQSIKIPSKITKIGIAAFSDCYQLQNVDFEANSKLQIIDNHAFCRVPIKTISIPSSVTHINDSAFACCPKLLQIEFNDDSKLQKIGKSAFYLAESILSIVIPSTVTTIGKCAFHECEKLQKIEFAKNSKLQLIDNKVFSETSISIIKIPSNVEVINNYAFASCKKLRDIEFEKDSKLQIINDYAFEKTLITNLSIPSKIIKIGEFAFADCGKLQIIEIIDSSELKIIEKNAFQNCNDVIVMISVQSNNHLHL